MKKQKTLLISAILCVVAIVLSIALKSWLPGTGSEDDGRTGQGNAQAFPTDSNSQENPRTKRERQGQAESMALRDLEKEFDEILPAQYPEQPSSLSDVTLQPGESLVLDGFRRADGNYEFTILEVERINLFGNPLKSGDKDGSPLQYQVRAKMMAMSREASLEAGLGDLISPAKTKIQKNRTFTSAEAMEIFKENTTVVSSKPSIVTRPDTRAIISFGATEQGHAFSMMASPVDGGDSVRLRLRIERPAGE